MKSSRHRLGFRTSRIHPVEGDGVMRNRGERLSLEAGMTWMTGNGAEASVFRDDDSYLFNPFPLPFLVS